MRIHYIIVFAFWFFLLGVIAIVSADEPQEVTLRPVSNGDIIELQKRGDSYNYQCVDDVTPDYYDTHVFVRQDGGVDFKRDFYNFQNMSPHAGDIQFIKVYIVAYRTGGGSTQIGLYINGTEYYSNNFYGEWGPWHKFSYTWYENPSNGHPWNYKDINNLQIGIKAHAPPPTGREVRVTQIYAVVNYTNVSSPTNLTVKTHNHTVLNLSWQQEEGYNTVILRKIGSYPTSPDDENATEVYNDTGTMFQDTGLTGNTDYYYRAWGYRNYAYSEGNTSDHNYTLPSPPINLTTEFNSQGHLVFSWDNQSNETYIIRYKNDSYPALDTGVEKYNGSGDTYTDTDTSGRRYYTMWTRSNISGYYSIPVYVEWGGIGINCFNESDSSQALTFNVFISDKSGETVYTASGCTNTHYIDYDETPFGEDTIIKINSSGYNDRIYYVDLQLNECYRFNAYLPNNNETSLYMFMVIDETDQPVPNARFKVKAYISETVGYENVTAVDTDGYGQVSVFLIKGQLYKVQIEKTGYKVQVDDFYANPTDFDHTFKIYYAEQDYKPTLFWWETIEYSGNTEDNVISVKYKDYKGGTKNVNFTIYRYNPSDDTYQAVYWYNTSSQNQVSFSYTGSANTTYTVRMYLNHTTYGYVVSSLILNTKQKLTTKTFFDNLFSANYGSNPFGWSNFIGFMLLVACLFAFGERGAGISLMGCGMVLLFVNNIIGFTVIAVVVPIVFIILGILVEWRNRQKGVYM